MPRKEEFSERDVLAYVRGEPLRKELASRLAAVLGLPLWTLTEDVRLPCSKHVFVILAAAREEWQVDLRDQLFRQLQAAQLFWTPFLVQENFSWTEQEELWARVLARKREFDGGLVVVGPWGADHLEDLRSFAVSFGKPLIYIDRNPDDGEQSPENVSYVSVNDERGGARAAEGLVCLAGLRPKRVLAVSGKAKPKRVLAFERDIGTYVAGCEVHTTFEGGFDRGVAAEVGVTLLAGAIQQRRPFDAVYTTSDSMGFGLLDATSEIAQRYGCEPPPIFSYDGLPDIRAIIATGRLAGTLIQDASTVALAAVDELIARLYEHGVPRRLRWVQPELFGARQNCSTSKTRAGFSDERACELDGLLRAFALLCDGTLSNRRERQLIMDRINLSMRRAPSTVMGKMGGRTRSL